MDHTESTDPFCVNSSPISYDQKFETVLWPHEKEKSPCCSGCNENHQNSNKRSNKDTREAAASSSGQKDVPKHPASCTLSKNLGNPSATG